MEKKERVLVGMSGGVDSTAAAAILQDRGYEVIGCTLRLYDGPTPEGGCCSLEDVEDARCAACHLGIDFYTFNFTECFRTHVVDDFVHGYQNGDTPNPCIQCNRHVKFSALLRRAADVGADRIATGHYARVDFAQGRWRLCKGLDRRKDQSYFLYPLPQETLCRLLLPLGEMDKAQVRALVEEKGLLNARKKDSQDICFVPDGDYPGFLRHRSSAGLVPGDFVDTAGNVLGQHRGLACYTVGQRRGLGVSAPAPLYVLRKDPRTNTVVLGPEKQLYTDTVWAKDFQWVSLPPIAAPLNAAAKIRYSLTEASGILYPEENGCVRFTFHEPQRAAVSGQSLVIYKDEAVVGGGIITSPPACESARKTSAFRQGACQGTYQGVCQEE